MGAQKVKADFTAIQKEAEMLDEMKEQQEAQAKVEATRRLEEEERQVWFPFDNIILYRAGN